MLIILDLYEVYQILDRIEKQTEIATIDSEALMQGIFNIIKVKNNISSHIALLNELIADHFYNAPIDDEYSRTIVTSIASDLFNALITCYNSMCNHGLYLDNQLHYEYKKRLSARKAAFIAIPKQNTNNRT